jgi:hypothetical protein
MSLEYKISETMFEWGFVIQRLVNRGWTLRQIEYGEERMGVGPRLLLERGGEQKWFYHQNEVEDFEASQPLPEGSDAKNV